MKRQKPPILLASLLVPMVVAVGWMNYRPAPEQPHEHDPQKPEEHAVLDKSHAPSGTKEDLLSAMKTDLSMDEQVKAASIKERIPPKVRAASPSKIYQRKYVAPSKPKPDDTGVHGLWFRENSARAGGE